jgi:hypothetical protein
MDQGMITGLMNYGAVGILAGVSLYQVVYLQQKIFQVIENNNKALGDLKAIIDKCQVMHERKV